MLFPPRSHLQILRQYISTDGVSFVELRLTTFQNIRTVEEVLSSRKHNIQHLAVSLTWDLRNEMALQGKADRNLDQQLDAFQSELVALYCGHEPIWYNDLIRYKSAFQELVREAGEARRKLSTGEDLANLLFKNLHLRDKKDGQTPNPMPAAVLSSASQPAQARTSNDVAALHSRFILDPNFKGMLGKFGNDELFGAGIESVVGPMDVQPLRGNVFECQYCRQEFSVKQALACISD